MSTEALPYTVLILLVELAVGSLAFATAFEARGMVTRGYTQMTGVVVVPAALLALWVAATLSPGPEVDGYALRSDWLEPFRWAVVAFIAVALGQFAAAVRGRRRESIAAGALGSGFGVVALGLLAGVVAPPAWSYAGVLGSMLAAAAALGGSLMAMSWGHWYLTNAGLPKRPLEEMSLVLLGALALQALFLVIATVAPVREVPLSDAAFGVSLAENPAFWLRIGAGLAFPFVLAFLAWRAASIRGMMSATGLLYITVGLLFTGEVLARGLLFATGVAV